MANDRLKSTTMLLKLNGDLAITNHAEMTPIIVAQLAKCKQAIEAMQPFIDKMKKEAENEKKEKQEKYVQSRKNTIRKTMDLTNSRKSSKAASKFAGGNAAFDTSNMVKTDPLDELKYQSDDDDYGGNNKGNRRWGNHIMSGKRDVVFKKGFMSKQGKKFKHFHERYFILWSNGLMHYYSNEHTVFSTYVEKSKSNHGSNRNSDSNDGSQQQHSNSNNNSLKVGQGGQSPIKSSKTSIHDDDSMAFDSDDENNSFPKISPQTNIKKQTRHKASANKIKRKSTFAKLGLKSDTIKPKGIIDINDLIETQFLEFTDNSPGWALITPEREWKFKCSTDRERREWIAAVHAVNYGISPYDFQNLGMNISYKHNTMLLEPSQNSFLGNKQTSQMSVDENSNAIAQGWMYKLGAAVRGLEQNYWKKRWVSLYKKPARLAYAQHPYSLSDLENTPTTRSSIIPKSSPADLEDTDNEQQQQPTKAQPSVNGTKKKVKKSNIVKGVIQLNDVTNIIRIGDNDVIKNKYRSPTVHVFALITEKRTWVFACKTAEECQMWYDRIAFFLPDQWKNDNKGVNLDELLRFNRVKTMAGDLNNDDEEDQKGGGGGDNHLSVNNGGKRKKSGDDTVMSKVFRKISNVSQSLGFTEEYSTISGVQPKGTITDYNDAMDMMDDNNNTNYVALQDENENDEQ